MLLPYTMVRGEFIRCAERHTHQQKSGGPNDPGGIRYSGWQRLNIPDNQDWEGPSDRELAEFLRGIDGRQRQLITPTRARLSTFTITFG